MILFIDKYSGACYVHIIEQAAGEKTMTATRPSNLIMASFIAAAALIFAVAAAPVLHTAALMVA